MTYSLLSVDFELKTELSPLPKTVKLKPFHSVVSLFSRFICFIGLNLSCSGKLIETYVTFFVILLVPAGKIL